MHEQQSSVHAGIKKRTPGDVGELEDNIGHVLLQCPIFFSNISCILPKHVYACRKTPDDDAYNNN